MSKTQPPKLVRKCEKIIFLEIYDINWSTFIFNLEGFDCLEFLATKNR